MNATNIVNVDTTNIINGVISSGIWAIILAILASSWTFASNNYRKKKKYVIWSKIDKKKELAIMMSLRDGAHPTSTKRTSLSEAIALADIIPIYKELKLKYKILPEYHKDILTNYSYILSMGGPTANKLTKECLSKYHIPVVLRYKSENPEARTTQVGIQYGDILYSPIYSDDSKNVSTDYSLIIAIFEKTSENQHTYIDGAKIIVVGCHGFGTRGAIECLQSKELAKKFKQFDENSFVAIVECNVLSNGNIKSKIKQFIAIDDFLQ